MPTGSTMRLLGLTAALLLLAAGATTPSTPRNVPVRRLASAADSPRPPVPGRVKGDIFTELNETHVSELATLDPNATALVMVDVWTVTDPILLGNYAARLLPLLSAARELGFFIVHAPSESPLWPNITVKPGEALVSGEDGHAGSPSRCDGVIRAARGGAITHVLLGGYDTNLCVIDKPCGAVSLSTGNFKTNLPPALLDFLLKFLPISIELNGEAEVILVRDTTRPGPDCYGNRWISWELNVNMIESAAWLPATGPNGSTATSGGIRSLVLPDLLAAFGMNPASLPPIQSPALSLTQLYPPTRHHGITTADFATGGAAIVVVSAADDWTNEGFGARVSEHMHTTLVPLIAAARAAGIRVIHVPNGHRLASSCRPLPVEFIANTTGQFKTVLSQYHITNLAYVGYAANRDVMWGVGGMSRYYATQRYLKINPPTVAWVP